MDEMPQSIPREQNNFWTQVGERSSQDSTGSEWRHDQRAGDLHRLQG